jgi:hypothetical protein
VRSQLLALRFLSSDIEAEGVSTYRSWFDLKNIEQTGPHQIPEFFVNQIRTIGFAAKLAETPGNITWTESLKTFHRDPSK